MDPQPDKKKLPVFRVRPQNRETKFVKLRSMKCFREVHERIIDGWPLAEIARFVQDERREYGDVTRDGFLNILKEYRATIPPAQLIQKRMPPTFAKAAEEVRKGLDELEELEKLYQLQMRRIGIDEGTEKKINKLMPSMTQEVRVAAEILARIASLKMDLGLSERHLGKVDIDAKIHAEVEGRYGSQAVIAVIQNPEARRKVLGLAERLLQLGGKKSDLDPDATLTDVVAAAVEAEEPVEEQDESFYVTSPSDVEAESEEYVESESEETDPNEILRPLADSGED